MVAFPRTLVAVLISITLHAALVATLAGVAVFKGWQVAKQVDIELVSISETKVEALPFGPPPPAPGTAQKKAAGRRAKPRVAAADEGVKIAAADAGAPDAGPPGDAGDGGAPETGGDALPDGAGDPDAGDGGQRLRRDDKITGPAGSRLTALLRLDRLRAAPNAAATIAAVDGLMRRLPDRRLLLDGTGLDLYRDFDTLYIATPNPMDASVTFLVARHRLPDAAMMAALGKGGEAAGRPITWSTEGGRPVGLRARAEPPLGPDGLPLPRRVDGDERIFVLPERGLIVMAPPAYAPILLGSRKRAEKVLPDVEAAKASELRWRDIVRRIDAEDGATPESAVLVMSAVNVFQSRTARHALPESAGGVALGPGGLPLPGFATMHAGVSPAPYLELVAHFEKTDDAAAWAAAWPRWKQTLLGSPILLFSGFSPIVARASVVQEDNTAVLRTSGTRDELHRLLGMLGNLVQGAQRR